MSSTILYFTVVAIVAIGCGVFVHNLEQGLWKWITGSSHSAMMVKGTGAFSVLIVGLMLVGYMESLS